MKGRKPKIKSSGLDALFPIESRPAINDTIYQQFIGRSIRGIDTASKDWVLELNENIKREAIIDKIMEDLK